MSNLLMYCLSLNDEDFHKIRTLKYIPVGLGNNKFNANAKDNNCCSKTK